MNMKYTFQPGEYWWGGTTIHKLCPITEKSEYHFDFRVSAPNQTASFFVSDRGRFIYSPQPFKIDISEGVIEIEGEDIVMNDDSDCLRGAYRLAQRLYFPCDGKELKKEFFRTPQFNSWIQFAYYPTQEGVLKYAREIIANGYAPGIFIIDEGWHVNTAYGSWEFDFARFPDPKAMVDELHALGFTVMLWVVPFVCANGPAYVRSLRPVIGTDPESAKHIYKRTEKGEVAAVKWWNGTSAILDLTSPWDEKFLDSQLRGLMEKYGIDGFKFDGGTLQHYTDGEIVNGKYERSHTPAEENRAWNEFGRRYPFHEYKDTFSGGGRNCIQRLHDRDHRWEGNGIDDIIPCAVVCGLIGHPFVCPDMVGGGEWSNRYTPGFKVDEELFVRMAQCSALFPMMQFSWAPWEALSAENAKLCLDAAKLHSAMADELIRLVKEAEKTGEPIIRCLEYNDPHRGYKDITDEYMVGEELLAAPVITQGTFSRDVTFPSGKWKDEDGNIYEGGTTVHLPAPLDRLLWFRRTEP